MVLIPGVSAADADQMMHSIADDFGLQNALELQAGFAASLGHRQNVSRYHTSVNKRAAHQFVPPHSEGSSFTNMEMASFFCTENSTDGGEMVLMNVNESGEMWELLREKVVRARPRAPAWIAIRPGSIYLC